MTDAESRAGGRRGAVLAAAWLLATSLVAVGWFVWLARAGEDLPSYARTLSGWLFAVAAVVIARRYGRTRLAVLLGAVAVATLLPHALELWASRNSWVWLLGSFVVDVDFLLLMWALLAYPEGHVRQRWARWLLVAVWASWALQQPLSRLFYDPAARATRSSARAAPAT